MLNRILFPLFVFMCVKNLSAQERIMGTLKQSTAANAVMVAIRSNTTFSGNFSNVQFTIQIPNTVEPQPVVQIKSNPLNTFIPTANYLTQVVNEGGFYTYLFAATVTGSPTFNFTSGTEVDALELMILNGPATTNTVRLSHLPDGGSTGQLAFYTELNGNDFTNYTTSFYVSGSGSATNGGSLSSYSFTTLPGVTLPVKFASFFATKRNNDAQLNWAVENQNSAVKHFEIERSFNGISFTKIADQNPTPTTNGNASYNLTDAGVFDNFKGTVYYRIKQVDYSGVITYSIIRSLKITSKAFALSLYPNPVVHAANIVFNLEKAQPVTITLVDGVGKTISNYSMQAAKGINQKNIDVKNLAAGTYTFIIKTENDMENLIFVKSN